MKKLRLSAIIIGIGLIAAVAAGFLTSIVKVPVITEHDFPYSVTYTLHGETQTFADICTCSFVDMGRESNPSYRYYERTYLKSEDSYHPGCYTIDEKDGMELRIVTIFTADHLMGDGDDHFYNEIYLAAYDDMGTEYTEPEILEKFDAEIISYELPTPVENTFVFGGFSILHDVSMAAMLGVGILVIIACLIFVKREEGIAYAALDKVSIVFNFVIGIIVIPFILLIVWLSQLFVSEDSFMHQLDLCIPAISAFAVAASLCLRRKGFSKSGFFVQFVGPGMEAVLLLLDAIL